MSGLRVPGLHSRLGERARVLLRHHLSDINANAITQHAFSAARRQSGDSEPSEELLLDELSRAARIFLSPDQKSRFLGELRDGTPEATSAKPAPSTRSIQVRSETDLNHVRAAVREVCDELGLSGFPSQRIVTATTELARNIAKYVGDGLVRLSYESTRRVLVVIAEDGGPGIPNLPQILAGRYHSRTGLGRGLLGTKKLADEFAIETGPTGTRVELTFTSPREVSAANQSRKEGNAHGR